MQYHSTRDKSISVSSAEAIKTGLSAEGGLFVPESFPSVSLDEIKNLASKSYNERAYFVLSKFLSDFTEEELKKCIDSAYTKEKFETMIPSSLNCIRFKIEILKVFDIDEAKSRNHSFCAFAEKY